MKRITEPLAKHTWFKIGGPAEIAIPETKSEFIELLSQCHQSSQSYRLLGNGSNLLVSDEGIDDLVIKTTEACTQIEIANETVHVGASVAVPQFSNTLVQHGLGGYEYLYSVPGTIGGAVFMNAGRGKSHQKTISDHLIEVEIFDGEDVRTIDIDKLDFSNRYSTFHDHPDWTILSATFDPPLQPREVGQEMIKERMQKVNERERSKPNAGSVFSSGTKFPNHRMPPNGLCVGEARFVQSNRICNDGNATFSDVIRLIRLARILNRFIPPFKKSNVEYRIWR